MLDTRETLLHEIKDRLTIYGTRVRAEQGKLSDGAEDLYRGLLSIMLGCKLKNMNHKQENFPAIDLGDENQRICVQVTSTGTRAKVRHTLKEFFDNKLHERFDRLIVLVIGDAQKFDTEPKNDFGFDFQTRRDIWDTIGLFREIGKIEDDDALEKIAAYLQKRVNIPRQEPFLDLVMGSAMPDDRFVGRGEELRRIEEELTKNRVAFLSGLGGMGKTELALRYGDGYRSAGRGQVYFVRFKKTFDQTVTDNIAPFIPGFNRDGLNEQQIIDGALKHLRRGDPGDLLILDNVDEIGSYDALTRDSVFRKLRELPMKLLVTTRLHARGGIELKPLSNPELYRFFEQHDLDLETGTMDKLIAAVNAHTMTVDLMARTMDESWETVTAEMILEAMENCSLPEADYPEVYTDHNQDPEQRQIYAHLRSLFNLTNIPEDGKQALRCATLLPQNGMDPALFLRGLPKGPADAIRLLEKQGWVQKEKHLLIIHPVVRLVCRTELKPDEEHCGGFLGALWGQFDPRKHERVKFAQLAEVFANAMGIEGTPQAKAEWLNHSGRLWLELMESRRCAALYEAYIPVLEPQIPTHPALATAYNNVGTTYGDLGDHNKALEYLLKALAICEKVLPQDHPDLAASYNSVGYTYGCLGDHNKALQYQLKDLAICEKVLPQDHPDLAASYNNVGYTYGELGNHAKALEYKLKALAIWEKSLPEDHPYNAMCCGNIACTYYEMDQRENALNYMRRAADIAERSLPEGHPHRVNFRRWAERFEREIGERQTSE